MIGTARNWIVLDLGISLPITSLLSNAYIYSPQCPQNHVDVGYLLRIPESLDENQEEVAEDEFQCLNLNVSVPGERKASEGLFPVLIWIYGTPFPSERQSIILTSSRRFSSRQLPPCRT
jgi:hypothetical protein